MNVSVIGAGPIGCIAAYNLSRHNDVSLFQEPIDRKVRCAGLISKSGTGRLGLRLRKSIIKNKVRGAILISPYNERVEIDGREIKAYVIDRNEFDEFLLERAIDNGVELVERRISKNDIKNLNSDRIIIATGTNYNLQKKLGINSPREFLVGAQYVMKVDCDDDFVELHFNVPGFFSWIIPTDDYARVGLCSKRNPTPYLEKFVRELKRNGRIKSDRIIDRNFGIIPIYNPKIRTDYGKILLVGDSAGHVKASTGGGIITGGIAANFVGDIEYEYKWRKEIGRELFLHLLIHRFLSRLSAKNISRLLTLLGEYKHILEKNGDMDIASRNMAALFKNPKFMVKFILNLPFYALDLL